MATTFVLTWLLRPPEAEAAYHEAESEFYRLVQERDRIKGDRADEYADWLIPPDVSGPDHDFMLRDGAPPWVREAHAKQAEVTRVYQQMQAVRCYRYAMRNEDMMVCLRVMDLRGMLADDDGDPRIRPCQMVAGYDVTPSQIRASLERLAATENIAVYHDGQLVQWWPTWIDWLKGAEGHGGFHVS